MSDYEPVHRRGDGIQPIGRRSDNAIATWALLFGFAGLLAVGLQQVALVAVGDLISPALSAGTGFVVLLALATGITTIAIATLGHRSGIKRGLFALAPHAVSALAGGVNH